MTQGMLESLLKLSFVFICMYAVLQQYLICDEKNEYWYTHIETALSNYSSKSVIKLQILTN